ncbi:DUF6282 family protein [Rhodococcus sp. NPDC003382]|uniref:DUF6282 family protein n=1 Tax=Rhodococcus phenolicus TaxID=263849 RepID=UPI0008295F82|nr:DUF6282 family protein [Rhodococcus phenolicus]
MTERRSGTAAIALDGAIDMHCHFGPEPLVEMAAKTPHSVDPVEAAREAADHGMKAIVLKAHEFPSTVAAHLANKAVPEVQSISGICLDHPVGGLNPHAVECALRAGAKVVWLPTISSQQDAPAKVNAFFGVQEGIRVIDADGELLPEVRTILDLITQYDAVLATGHVSTAEHFAVAREYGTRGRVLVTHAMHATTGPRLTIQEVTELAGLGAHIEFAAHTCMGEPSVFADVVAALRRLDAEKVVLATDYGWTTKVPHPAAGLHSYVNALWDEGVDEDDLRVMTCDTPARLLGMN